MPLHSYHSLSTMPVLLLISYSWLGFPCLIPFILTTHTPFSRNIQHLAVAISTITLILLVVTLLPPCASLHYMPSTPPLTGSIYPVYSIWDPIDHGRFYILTSYSCHTVVLYCLFATQDHYISFPYIVFYPLADVTPTCLNIAPLVCFCFVRTVIWDPVISFVCWYR